MTLQSVRKGVRPAPDRVLVVGTDGVGKSTFAAAAPNPIFIAPEDGVRHLDVASFPELKTWPEVFEALRTLATAEHDFKTAVIDTVDWLEPLCHRYVCEQNGWKDIEVPGYGKGYVPATEEWRKLLAALDFLRAKRGMEVILLAHAAIKNFSNPAGDDFSRYELKLQKSASALLKEWCDANLFAVHEEFVNEAKGITKAKGVSTGFRVLHTERTAAWDAKNRHNLPHELPLSYEDYAAARAAGRPADPAELLEEAIGLVELLDQAAQESIRPQLTAHATDAAWLYQAVMRLRSKVSEQE